METVGDLGERELVRLLRREIGMDLAGDDAAVLPALSGPAVTVDSYFEGVHFHRWWCPPEILGRRLLEATLSDLAAMGALPRWLLAAVSLPPRLDVEWLLAFYRGMTSRPDCELAGGETVRGDAFGVTLTAIGNLAGNPLTRSGAVPGEILWVTGPVGRSLDSPELLSASRNRSLSPSESRQVDLFLNPAARFDASGEIVSRGCRTAIDISDGLLSEAWHLSAESRVGVALDPGSVPLVEYARGRTMEACSAGEDFELMFTAEPDARFPDFHPIGRIMEGKGVVFSDSPESPVPPSGYDHFRG